MEQLTAICFEDPAAVHLRRLQGPWAERVLGPRAHARHAADARRDHVRGGRAVVQLLRPTIKLMDGVVGFGGLEEVRFRGVVRPGDRFVIVSRLLKVRTLDHDLRIPVLRQPEPGLRRHHQGDRLAGRSIDRRRQHRRRCGIVRAAPLPMGRRSLRKIDSDVDLSRHLRQFEELPRPWDRGRRVRPRAPLEMEVGSGKGLFLRTAAAARPDVDFLGVRSPGGTPSSPPPGLAKQNLPNAAVVCGDALRVFHELLPDASLAAVHVYFPDPWWKKRHRKRRVMQEPLAAATSSGRFSPAARCTSGPTWRSIFIRRWNCWPAIRCFAGPMEVPETPAEHDMAYRTHFERRMRLHNEPVYRAEFRKQP